MKYLIDTNIASFAIRGIAGVKDRLVESKPSEISISTVSESELWFGVRKKKSKKLEKSVENFLKPINKTGFSSEAAKIYGDLYAKLESKGMSIGICDTMIAAIAIEHELILVTDNVRHLKRIKNLKVENWI